MGLIYMLNILNDIERVAYLMLCKYIGKICLNLYGKHQIHLNNLFKVKVIKISLHILPKSMYVCFLTLNHLIFSFA